MSKYGNFDLAMDSFYHQENLCIEGMRELYFPIDNSYEEYSYLLPKKDINIDVNNSSVGGIFPMNITSAYENSKNAFRFMVYIVGAPPSLSNFKFDIYCNFECLPNAEFLNYMPVVTNTEEVSSVEKKRMILEVQEKPIMKANEVNIVKEEPSFWQRVINKLKNNVPGIKQLIQNNIIK